jgi:protein-disulfide isomerase
MSSHRAHRFVFARLAAAFSLTTSLLAAGQSPAVAQAPAEEDPVVAMVAGKPITRADVEEAAAAELEALDMRFNAEEHALIEAKLREVVAQRLLEAEAKARGITPEQVSAGIPPVTVTDAEIDAFYEENKERIPRPKAEVSDQIRQYLQQSREAEARQAFYNALETKHAAQYLLEPIRVEVDSEGFPEKGPADAPVTIVEFSDFECPFCARVGPTLDQVLAKYPTQVRLVFRHFPLDFHPNAQKAAEASLCADVQGKFWGMHDAMLGDQGGLGVDALKAKAAALGMDAEEFAECLDSGDMAELVQYDKTAGAALGVTGTPGMFINGRFINGAVPFEDIVEVIDDELQRR